MIDFDKLDKISELPISEEMLGAYLEDNLDLSEAAMVETMIDASPILSEIFDECAVITDNAYSIPFDENIQVDNIDLAEIDPRGDIPEDDISEDLDGQQENPELESVETIDKYFNNGESEEDDLNDMEGTDSSETGEDFGFNNEQSLEVFAEDVHDINEGVCSDFDHNINFSELG